jgi:hypothetical protein
MSIYIRPRSKGSAFELRVKHKRLARPAYATLGSREAAEALGHRTLAALERGEMPDWLKEPVRRECDTTADLIRPYRGIIAVPPDGTQRTVCGHIGWKESVQLGTRDISPQKRPPPISKLEMNPTSDAWRESTANSQCAPTARSGASEARCSRGTNMFSRRKCAGRQSDRRSYLSTTVCLAF